jgi:hypothetical protein
MSVNTRAAVCEAVLGHNCGGGPAAGVLEVSDGVKSVKTF